MFPGAHHLPGHGIQVVPLVLGPVVEAVAGLERGTLVAVAANLLLITFSRLIPKNIYFYLVLLGVRSHIVRSLGNILQTRRLNINRVK